jgi:uncharacterized protein
MLKAIVLIFGFVVTSCAQTISPLARWLHKAQQGNADAQFWLAASYESGRGVNRDLSEATKWLRKSAKQGNPDAQNLLGHMYENGEGVPLDYVKAAEWYRAACEHRPDLGGAGQGCNNLGLLYLDGNGVRRDMIEAYKYFEIAGAERNVEIAKRKMTAPEAAEAQRRTKEWIESHPDQ